MGTHWRLHDLPAVADKKRKRRRRRLERSVEDSCVRLAKDRGWKARKMNGLGFRDWPDRLFLPPPARGYDHFWVEFKRDGKEPTPSQAEMHADLRVRNQWVCVCHTREEFAAVLDRMEGRHG